MSRQVVILGLLSTLMLGGSCGSSCVQFDGQTVRAHVDTAKDRLDALLLYRHLSSTSPDTSKAVEQLETALGGARWFALISNFPFAMNVDHMAAKEPDPEHPALQRFTALCDANIEVRSGNLWVDESGGLDGWQLVRVRNFSEVVDAVNALIVASLREADAQGELEENLWMTDEESLTLLHEAVRRGDPFFAVDGQTLTFSWPASDAGWRTAKRRVLEQVAKGREALDEERNPERAQRDLDAGIAMLADNDWSIERRPGLIVFVLGSRFADELRIEVPTVGLDGTDLADDLRARGWAIEAHGDDASAHAAYEAFRDEG